MASQVGLEAVTIGALAKATKMSKSGLFAHFQSKENLQLAIIDYAARAFADNVVVPALMQPAGITRIKALVNNWISWGSRLTGGCIFVSAAGEFSDRPGNVRDGLLQQQEDWIECLRRIAKAAIRVGEFKEGIDCDQFAFELYSLLLGFHLYHKMLESRETKHYQQVALDRLLSNYR